MTQVQASLTMMALFALRCIVPIALTMALCYAMNRLVDHWEAQDAAQVVPERVPVPVSGTIATGPALLSLPCWLMNNCPDDKRQNCAAFKNRAVPCWQARLEAEGVLPDGCPDCPRYQPAIA